MTILWWSFLESLVLLRHGWKMTVPTADSLSDLDAQVRQRHRQLNEHNLQDDAILQVAIGPMVEEGRETAGGLYSQDPSKVALIPPLLKSTPFFRHPCGFQVSPRLLPGSRASVHKHWCGGRPHQGLLQVMVAILQAKP